MPQARTTDDLLTDVRARVVAPSANGLLSSAELLQLIDEEMRSELAGLLISMRSDYWLTSETQTLTSGTASYRLPSRAIGMTLADVTVYDSAGNEWNLFQVPTSERYEYATPTSITGNPVAFTLENGSIVLLPTPGASSLTLRLRYYRAPSRLELASNCAPIQQPNTTTTLTVSSAPAGVGLEADALADIVRGDGMFEPTFTDLQIVNYATGASGVEFDVSTPYTVADVATYFAPGNRRDYLCLSGRTCYPPIPDTLWPVLVALGCKAYCEAIGDGRGLAAATSMLERKTASARSLMMPRVDGEVPRVVPRFTPLRGGGGYGGWGRWGQ